MFIRGNGNLRVRKQWYISFLLILLIPVLAGFLIFSTSEAVVEQQIQETNHAYLQLMVQSMEGAVSGMDQIADMLRINSDFAMLRYIQSDITTAQRYKMYYYSHSILGSIAQDSLLTHRAVFLRSSDRILNGNTYATAEHSYDSYFSGISLSWEEFRRMLDTPHDRDYLVVSIGPKEVILCLQSIPWTDDRFDSTVIVAIDAQGLTTILDEASWNRKGTICVLDGENQLLLCSGDRELAEMIRSEEYEPGEKRVTLNGETYLCLCQKSGESRLTYLYAAPYSVVYEKAVSVKFLSLLTIFCCLLAGGMGIVYLVNINYRPVKKILRSLDVSGEEDGTAGEYDIILDRIEAERGVTRTLQKQLEEKHRMLGREVLERFLTGRMSGSANVFRVLENHGMPLNQENYAVVCLDTPAFFGDFGENVLENTAEFLKERMPEVTLYHTAEDMRLVLLLGFSPQTSEKLEKLLRNSITELRESFHIGATAGLSCVRQDPAAIPDMYRQAATALEHTWRRGEILVRYPEQPEGEKYRFRLEDEMALMQAVQQGREEAALSVLNGIMEIYSQQIDASMNTCLRFDLVAAFMRVVLYADSILQRDEWDGARAAHDMFRAKSMDEVYALFQKKIRDICAALQNKRSRHQSGIPAQVLAYVEAHWNEPGLDVNAISQAIGVHPSYVSRLFKEEQGIGLLEYINRYRVECAAELLNRRELSVCQVASMCGFSSDASFIRVFKQYKGMTPGRFRDDLQEKSENVHASEIGN